jgi:hypothetical protein
MFNIHHRQNPFKQYLKRLNVQICGCVAEIKHIGAKSNKEGIRAPQVADENIWT